MSSAIWIPLAVALVSAIPASRAILTIRHDRRMGVRQADREDRAIDSEAADRLIARLEGLVERYEHRAEDAERRLAVERRHADDLTAHIWQGLPPPPPPRPVDASP